MNEDLKKEASEVFAEYWQKAKLMFNPSALAGIKPFLEIGFISGYVEGYRTHEEKSK